MKLFSKKQWLKRRDCIVLALVSLAEGLSPLAQAMQAKAQARILVLGDSLSAEYGLKRGSGWVALLEVKLATQGISAEVINASISGDTTSGGRARLDALLAKHQPSLVVIELGGNDALRGLSMAQTQENLLVMSQAAQKAHARVLLLGMQVPPNYGSNYAMQFASMYHDVAKVTGAALVPFMLKGIADVPDSMKWFQSDRIHPNEAAHPLILANLWPKLKKGLK